MDLAKAFDTVPHELLLKKMYQTGIRGKALQWFRSYLCNRRHMLKYDDIQSEPMLISYGVPQGSVLGPVLFLVYINDLCSVGVRNGKVITFADDTVLLFRDKTWEEVTDSAQDGFNRVGAWLSDNILTLNASKTNFICFSINRRGSPKYNKVSIYYHQCICNSSANGGLPAHCTQCESLKRCSGLKYLGIHIDEHLNWREHIACLTGRVRKLVFFFRELRQILEPHQIKTIYFALCYSLINYGILAWGGVAKTIMDPAYKAQKLILKVMLGLEYTYPTQQLYKDTMILNVRQIYMSRLTLEMSKNESNMDIVQSRNTRQRGSLFVPQVYTSFARRFHTFLGPRLYNAVLPRIQPTKGNLTKTALSTFLLGLGLEESETLLCGFLV
jgi:hypothetical protein